MRNNHSFQKLSIITGSLAGFTEILIMVLIAPLQLLEPARTIFNSLLLFATVSPIMHYLLFRPLIKLENEHRIIEQELTDEKRLFSSVTESAKDAIICVNSQGRIFLWNKAAEEVFGYTEEEVMNKNFLLLLPQPLRQQMKDSPLFQPVEDKYCRFSKTFESTGLKKEGIEFPIEISLSSWQTAKGICFTAIVRDIKGRKKQEEEQNRLMVAYQNQYKIATDVSSELAEALNQTKRAEEQQIRQNQEMEKANKISREFLARMSHEFRTPIHNTMGMINLALETELTKEQREYLNTAILSSEALLSVVNNVLDFSNIETGHFELKDRVFSLRSVINKAVDMVSPYAREKGLPVNISITGNLTDTFMGDEIRLHQILLNLLSNAVKFTDRGEITIKADKGLGTEGSVEINFAVQDTGVGIPKDEQASIFDEFYQVDSSDSRRYGGTGLGLTLVKHLVEKMGGQINVKSNLWVGTTFNFSLKFTKQEATMDNNSEPVEAIKEAVPVKENQSAPPVKYSILVAEDNTAAQLIARMNLEKRGFAVFTAGNGLEVLEILQKEKIDLALMDVEMPVMSGPEATMAIRKKEAETGGHLPIIALTAYALKEDLERCLGCGMDSFVSKPVKYKDLCQEIEHLLSRQEAGPKEQAVDINFALDIVDGDRELLKQAVTLFLSDDYPRHLGSIKSAMLKSDFEAMARAGHGIKGAAANLGGKPLSELAAKLEKAAKDADAAEAEKQLAYLESEIQRFKGSAIQAGILDGNGGNNGQ
jgi:PAS domain S-box-containing protein